MNSLDGDLTGKKIGEYELLNELPMCNEVLTVLPTLLITVSKDDVKELGAEEQQMLWNNTEMMRTNEEVMMVYLENLYWKRFKHSMVDNVIAGHTVAGGSTLTQQTAKNLYYRPDRSN